MISAKAPAAQVTLPFVLVIGTIMIAIVSGLIFVSVLEATSIAQERAVATSRFLLETGLQDAMLKVTQDKTTNTSYNVSVTSGGNSVGSVAVQIAANTPGAGQTTVTLTATPNSILSVAKRAQAVLNVDTLGNVTIASYQEL